MRILKPIVPLLEGTNPGSSVSLLRLSSGLQRCGGARDYHQVYGGRERGVRSLCLLYQFFIDARVHVCVAESTLLAPSLWKSGTSFHEYKAWSGVSHEVKGGMVTFEVMWPCYTGYTGSITERGSCQRCPWWCALVLKSQQKFKETKFRNSIQKKLCDPRYPLFCREGWKKRKKKTGYEKGHWIWKLPSLVSGIFLNEVVILKSFWLLTEGKTQLMKFSWCMCLGEKAWQLV